MNTHKKIASVQYNDFIGTCAAGTDKISDLYQWFKTMGYLQENETLVGFQINFHPAQNKEKNKDKFSLKLFYVEGNWNKEKQERILERSVNDDFDITTLFSVLKRFEMIMHPKGISEDLK